MDNSLSDYQKALSVVKDIPKIHLGQEITTKDGTGIVVNLHMDYNGLHIKPHTSEITVWYSTEAAINIENGGNWATRTYSLLDLQKTKQNKIIL